MSEFYRSMLSDLLENIDSTFTKPIQPKDIHLELNVAGIKKEEIDISIVSDVLFINVDSKRGKYKKTIHINDLYDIDNIDVKYDSGLLIVDVPLKIKEKKSIKITIN